MTDAEIIQLERQIAEDTEATQIRLHSQFCPTCGTRKIRGVCEYCEPDAEEQSEHEQTCGNYYSDEVADMRHPNW